MAGDNSSTSPRSSTSSTENMLAASLEKSSVNSNMVASQTSTNLADYDLDCEDDASVKYNSLQRAYEDLWALNQHLTRQSIDKNGKVSAYNQLLQAKEIELLTSKQQLKDKEIELNRFKSELELTKLQLQAEMSKNSSGITFFGFNSNNRNNDGSDGSGNNDATSSKQQGTGQYNQGGTIGQGNARSSTTHSSSCPKNNSTAKLKQVAIVDPYNKNIKPVIKTIVSM